MTRARIQFDPTPRILSERQVAARLGRGESWLNEHRPALEAEGFPQVDPLLGGTDGNVIDHWLDVRAGITSLSMADPDMELEGWQP